MTCNGIRNALLAGSVNLGRLSDVLVCRWLPKKLDAPPSRPGRYYWDSCEPDSLIFVVIEFVTEFMKLKLRAWIDRVEALTWHRPRRDDSRVG